MPTLYTKGKVFEQMLAASQRAKRPAILVGFFNTARYPQERRILSQDGRKRVIRRKSPPPVAYVAAINEFGYGGPPRIPSRPFFRNTIMKWEQSDSPVTKEVRKHIDPMDMKIDEIGARRVGEVAKGMIQQSITELKTPPNSPITIALKGSADPLIDSGFMRQSVSYNVK